MAIKTHLSFIRKQRFQSLKSATFKKKSCQSGDLWKLRPSVYGESRVLALWFSVRSSVFITLTGFLFVRHVFESLPWLFLSIEHCVNGIILYPFSSVPRYVWSRCSSPAPSTLLFFPLTFKTVPAFCPAQLPSCLALLASPCTLFVSHNYT